MRKIWFLLACVIAALFGGSAYAQLSDITQPGDPLVPSSSNNPGSEGIANVIDNVIGTKYLNFDANNNALPTGFTVSPRVGLSVVQVLTLTSANDAPERDPATFVLSGSYDGSNFVQIASNSVPVFTNRFTKVVIPLNNNTPYLVYRLMFPTVVNAPTTANSMQIAEVELLGFLAPTDVTQPGDPLVPSSSNNPGSEGIANAIDNVSGTKYLNFDANNNALPTGFTVTPNVGGTLVSGITLTSANDGPERDPATFVLSGSLDGSNFVQIASNSVPPFPSRFYKNYIFFNNTRAYKAYRLMFPTVVNAPTTANSMQIAEVEFLGVAADLPQDVTQPGDPLVPSSSNNPGSEGIANVIDNVTGTKYLNFDANNNALPTGFTVSPRSGLTLVSGLTLTSANDGPERDPATFVLSGSYDGSNFVQIASNSVPLFTSRFQKQTILFDNNTPYLVYRLMFPTVVNAPTTANSMQIAEVEFLGVLAPTDVTVPGDPLVPSSSNNPGSEGIANAIDNVTGTKYLNFDAANNAKPTGFTVTPGVGDTIVNGLTLTSANDGPERDPATYDLSGSVDGINFLPISSGPVPPFPSRFYKNYIFFPSNTVAYKSYRLMFPTVVNAPTTANSMQIAEVEFLGFTPGGLNTNVIDTLIRRQPSDTPVLLGSQATFKVDLTGPWRVQWYRNGVAIPGASTLSYTTPAATAGDDGATFYAVVQSPQGQQESDHVILSIFTPSTTESIGVSWMGAGANGAPTAMLPSDITGFQRQAYWNNISLGGGTLANPTNSNNQINPAVTVTWATSGEWGAGTDATTPTGRMLNGMDTSFGTDSNGAQIVTFVAPPGNHSLLIYTVQVPLEFFNMNFQVITHDAGGGEIIQERYIRPQNSDEYNPTPGFILVTATVATNRSVGNMLRFDNLVPGADGIILVRFWSPGRSQPAGGQPIRGPGVNGMQLLLNPPAVGSPPIITQDPVSKNGAVDGQVALSVQATGTGLTYQWFKNGQAIHGETNSTLVLTTVTTNDIAKYTVAVANAAGRLVSRAAFVDVLPSEHITEGLILYYKFDDQGGPDFTAITDYSGHNVNGGVRGSSSPDYPPGISGSSLSLDGNVYGVTPNYPKPSAAMTVMGWIYPQNNPGFGPLINDWLPNNPIGSHGQFELEILPTGELRGHIAVGPNVPEVIAPVAATPDWHHFAMTANGSTLTLYWDGVAVDTDDYLGAINSSASAVPVNWLAIGANLNADTNQVPVSTFLGQMDDIAMFGRSLSDEEIQAIYQAGFSAGQDLSQVPPVITVAPRLSISRSGNTITISWRADFTGYVLKSKPDLSSPTWTPVPGVVNNSVTLTNPTGMQIFRLEK